MADYDTIIIGGGLSGLASAIRLAHFGKRVRLFERHMLPGGLNSYYPCHDCPGEQFDTGLHALTNFVPETKREAPLNRILRQLRIRRDELKLCPQGTSLISTPGASLILDNDFGHFSEQVAAKFPKDAEGFTALVGMIDKMAYRGDALPWSSTNAILARFLSSPQLMDLLKMPVMYYGCPGANDMDFQAYATMFKSVLMEGFARPEKGMKAFLETLVDKARDEGAELSFGLGIEAVNCRNGRVVSVTDQKGREHTAEQFITTIGAVESTALMNAEGRAAAHEMASCRPGQMAFVEGIYRLEKPAADYGFAHCIGFLNFEERFDFECTAALENPKSVLLCAPGNYSGCQNEKTLRISAMTDAAFWMDEKLSRADYYAAKRQVGFQMLQAVAGLYPELADAAKPADLFTPKTIQRFTGHCNGAIYGSPDKLKNFQTGMENLSVAGSDQGLLGIVGSMLSGIIAANDTLNP